jgi:hypothetical protein
MSKAFQKIVKVVNASTNLTEQISSNLQDEDVVDERLLADLKAMLEKSLAAVESEIARRAAK